MKTIAIINQKGGVSKSTTAEALQAGLILKGFKVLGIDLDAQKNYSFTMGVQNPEADILKVLMGETAADKAIYKSPAGDIIPASETLSSADLILTKTGKEHTLKKSLKTISEKYDYCIIDTPPALGVLTVNALTACNYAVIPAQADIYSLMGIDQLNNTIEAVKEYCNPELKIAGILLTRYSTRTVLNREIKELMDTIANKLKTKVFNTTIREAVAIKEAQINQKTIFEYAPKHKVTEEYKAFIEELLKEC